MTMMSIIMVVIMIMRMTTMMMMMTTKMVLMMTTMVFTRMMTPHSIFSRSFEPLGEGGISYHESLRRRSANIA